MASLRHTMYGQRKAVWLCTVVAIIDVLTITL